MKRNYLLNLTEEEKNVLNTKIDNQKMRNSLMAVLACLLRTAEGQVNQLSFSQLYKKFTGRLKKLSETTFKERIYKLFDLGLICIEKNGKTNLYKFLRFGATKVVDNSICEEKATGNPIENPTDINEVENIDIPLLSQLLNKHRIKNQELTNDLDSNKLESKNYSDEEIEDAVHTQAKYLHIRSAWVINKVLKKIKDYRHKIGNLENYTTMSLLNAKEENRINFEKSKINNPNALKFNNFTPRTYDYEDLEWQLLGWK